MAGDQATLGAESERMKLTWALAKVAAGEVEALEEVYRRTGAKLLGVISRIVHDAQEAEDVLQEVYLTIWRRAGSFDPGRGVSPITWLAAIARNRAIDRLRSGKARPVQPIEAADNIAYDAPSAFERLSRLEDGQRLAACLEGLEANRARAIRTAFFDGLTYEAVAGRLGAPVGTVKSWIRRGLAELKACLEP